MTEDAEGRQSRRRRARLLRRLGTPTAPRSRLRRRFGSAVRMLAALMLVGGLYAVFAPGVQAEDTSTLSGAAQQGQTLFDSSCITCHGRNAQGVPDKGPSLIGVGSAAVEFQVTTGRMPLSQQQNQADRKKPTFSDDQARDIGAYLEALGGGPQLPDGTDLHSNGDGYGSVFYRTTGFPGLHVTGGLIAFIFYLIRTTMGRFTPAQATAAIVVSYYWHFVDIVWVALFTMIYVIK